METHTLPPSQKPGLGTATTIVLWLVKLAAAGILGYAAWEKLTGVEKEVTLFTELNWEPTGRFLIGGIEIVAAILILIPQSSIYGAFLGLGVMLGAIIGHLSVKSTVIGVHNIWAPALVGALCITILYIRRDDAKFIRNLWER